MRRIVVTACMMLVGLISSAQVILFVQNPPGQVGNRNFTWADPGGGWGTPDLTDPANAITDTLVFAEDGTAEDSLCCNALTNANDVAGQIAVIYRGNCQFGVKVKRAQDAGARGVIIINNVPGAPVGMGPGTDGASDTIPVAMISDADGAALRSDIMAGNVVVFLGSKTGFYEHDLGFYARDIWRPEATGNPTLISQNGSELNFSPQAWVYNYGSEAQTGVYMKAEVRLGTDTIYSELSDTVSVPVGDSALFTFTPFSEPTYANGYYDFDYTLYADSTDLFPDDNVRESDFIVDDTVFAYSRLDETTFKPVSSAHFRPSNGTGNFQTCLAFRDANASRMGAIGMTFSATTDNTAVLTNLLFEVTAYSWDDAFSDLDDANFAMDNIVPLTTGEYSYVDDLQGEPIYVPFNFGIALTDNQRYLFCAKAFSANAFLGYDTNTDYERNIGTNRQPICPIDNAGSWFALGFGEDLVPALSVKMIDEIFIGIEEVEAPLNIQLYPNPAHDAITIDLQEEIRTVDARILDLSGRVVKSQQLVNSGANKVQMSVTDVARGNYVLNVLLDNGSEHSFKFMINK